MLTLSSWFYTSNKRPFLMHSTQNRTIPATPYRHFHNTTQLYAVGQKSTAEQFASLFADLKAARPKAEDLKKDMILSSQEQKNQTTENQAKQNQEDDEFEETYNELFDDTLNNLYDPQFLDYNENEKIVFDGLHDHELYNVALDMIQLGATEKDLPKDLESKIGPELYKALLQKIESIQTEVEEPVEYTEEETEYYFSQAVEILINGLKKVYELPVVPETLPEIKSKTTFPRQLEKHFKKEIQKLARTGKISRSEAKILAEEMLENAKKRFERKLYEHETNLKSKFTIFDDIRKTLNDTFYQDRNNQLYMHIGEKLISLLKDTIFQADNIESYLEIKSSILNKEAKDQREAMFTGRTNKNEILAEIKEIQALEDTDHISTRSSDEVKGLVTKSPHVRAREHAEKLAEKKWQETVEDYAVKSADFVRETPENAVPKHISDAQSELGKEIDERVEQLFNELSPDEFDKVLNDESVANQRLKARMQEIQDEQVPRKDNVNDLVTAWDQEDILNPQFFMSQQQADLDLFVRRFKKLQDDFRHKQAVMTPHQRKYDLLRRSYQKTLALEQARREFEMTITPNIEQHRRKLDHLREMDPRAYNRTKMELILERDLPDNITDLLITKALTGCTVAELQQYYYSFKYPELKKASYEIDQYADVRDKIMASIEERQERMRMLAGIKGGRRGRTPFLVSYFDDADYYDRYLMTKEVVNKILESPNSVAIEEEEEDIYNSKPVRIAKVLNKNNMLISEPNLPDFKAIERIHQRERIYRTDGHQPLLTEAEKRDRRMRTSNRRIMSNRLDNTIKAFMFMRKYRSHVFK